MANSTNPSRRSAGPSNRNDLIRCDSCGEYYSVTYKRCPFCDERPERPGRSGGASSGGHGRRVATNRRGGGYGGPASPVQIALVILSFVLVVAAAFIVIKTVAPLFHKDPAGTPGSSSVSTSQPAASSEQQSEEPAITLSVHELSLAAGEKATLTFKLSGMLEGNLSWSSSDETVAAVDPATGEVSNTNAGSTDAQAVITVTCGDKSDSCTVTCAPAAVAPVTPAAPSETGTIAPNTKCVITNAEGGLRIRSGPGTTYEVLVSTENGASVTVLADAGDGWYRIRYTVAGGKTAEGYVMHKYVKASK